MEGKNEAKPRKGAARKKNVKKGKPNYSKLLVIILIFALVVVGIIFLAKYIKRSGIEKRFLGNIHEDVSVGAKERSYFDLLLKTMNEHKDLVNNVEHVYFNLYDLPGLTHEEKENVAKKVLHSFAIHKDKELLIDTFDGLYFRNILNVETSEIKDGVYVTFRDLEMKSKKTEKQFEISIYKTSDINPSVIYDVKLDKDSKIVSYTKVSEHKPNEAAEKVEEKEDAKKDTEEKDV